MPVPEFRSDAVVTGFCCSFVKVSPSSCALTAYPRGLLYAPNMIQICLVTQYSLCRASRPESFLNFCFNMETLVYSDRNAVS